MTRCDHGMHPGLCVVRQCPHWDGDGPVRGAEKAQVKPHAPRPAPVTVECPVCAQQHTRSGVACSEWCSKYLMLAGNVRAADAVRRRAYKRELLRHVMGSWE